MHGRVHPAVHNGEYVEQEYNGSNPVCSLRNDHLWEDYIHCLCRVLDEWLGGYDRGSDYGRRGVRQPVNYCEEKKGDRYTVCGVGRREPIF